MFFLTGTIAVQFPEEKKTSDKQQRDAYGGNKEDAYPVYILPK